MRLRGTVYGDRKLVRKFLWRPLTIGHDRRWLEVATVEYEYIYSFNPYGCHYRWEPIRFVNT